MGHCTGIPPNYNRLKSVEKIYAGFEATFGEKAFSEYIFLYLKKYVPFPSTDNVRMSASPTVSDLGLRMHALVLNRA